jgi:integrase/recombinase XerD
MRGARPLTTDQTKAFLNATQRRREKALFTLGFCTGYRISEILSLTLGDVVTDGHLHSHITVKACNSKTKQGRSVLLNPTARAALAELVENMKGLPSDTPLFLSRKTANGKAKAISRQQAHGIIKKQFAAIGEYGNVSTHSLRKTFAAQIYQSTGKIELVQLALGHKAITSTMSYLSFNTSAIDRAIAELFQ